MEIQTQSSSGHDGGVYVRGYGAVRILNVTTWSTVAPAGAVNDVSDRTLEFPVDMLHTLSTRCELGQIYG